MDKDRKLCKPQDVPIIVENKIHIPKGKHIIPIIALIFSAVSLGISCLSTYWNTWPRYSLKIIDTSVDANYKAYKFKNYLDTNYVYVRVYNEGNKPISINNMRVNIEDANDYPLFVTQDIIYKPKVIYPEEIAECLMQIFLVRVKNPPPSNISELIYKFKYTNYLEWKMISDSLKILPLLNLDKEIKYSVTIYYSGNKQAYAERTVSVIGLKNPDKYK